MELEGTRSYFINDSLRITSRNISFHILFLNFFFVLINHFETNSMFFYLVKKINTTLIQFHLIIFIITIHILFLLYYF